ncbi:hypothetical protein QTP70_009243 [Hemibagrus guttatus]|uniref:Uncharacterized protein n=1 Tax=Hemibagrus guttatus TaxID=175788 RepID=A0AAE0QKC5_9TELE|nr:hypothetical protein QTP70_009243 [Hemibagrus guttatus]
MGSAQHTMLRIQPRTDRDIPSISSPNAAIMSLFLWVVVDLELIPGTFSAKQDYTRDSFAYDSYTQFLV